MRDFFAREAKAFGVLIVHMPPLMFSLYVLAVVLMNLLAGKELFTTDLVALDCGFLLSWLPFLFMDMMCRYYGPKPAAEIAVVALLINLAVCVLFNVVSNMPGHWAEYYHVDSTLSATVDKSLNQTIGGSWYILMGSFIAMLVSSITNSIIYAICNRFIHSIHFWSFAVKSYISTAISQFVDNLVFAIIVSMVLFGWSWTQILHCAVIAASFELVCEVIFSPIAYRMSIKWQHLGIGKDYFDFISARK